MVSVTDESLEVYIGGGGIESTLYISNALRSLPSYPPSPARILHTYMPTSPVYGEERFRSSYCTRLSGKSLPSSHGLDLNHWSVASALLRLLYICS